MELRSGKRKLDAYQPTFDPNLDIATVVFSHVQCVGTRVRLAQVSKLWRDASKLAAGYPRRFDFTDSEDILRADSLRRRYSFLIDNDEALSLPREQVIELLKSFREKWGVPIYISPRSPQEYLLHFAAVIGSVRMLKWARENDMHWPPTSIDCAWMHAAYHGHLPALQWLHDNGCPLDERACRCARFGEHWHCVRYLVDNKCPMWEHFAEIYAHRLT